MKKRLIFWTGLTFCLHFSFSCASTRLGGSLDPASEDFLSRVRYIITREESKIFHELPASGRPRFIREFWERRDPTPGTETNEYQDAYYERIEEASRLFRGARPGWLQDRGRIYVLFGPPNERQTNPMGGRPIDAYEDPRKNLQGQQVATGEKPTEIWIYYNLFSSLQRPHTVKLVFVDTHGTGDYQLATDLDELIPGGLHTVINPDLRFTHELNKEEAEKARLRLERALFDFEWEFLKEKDKALGSNLFIRIAVPYKRIVFGSEGRQLEANMELEIRIRDSSENVVWEKVEAFPLKFSQDFIDQNREGYWEAKVPVALWLERGKYTVYFHLQNSSGDQSVEKLLSLKM
jgi:GWxTD domain-containing protein